MASLLRRLRRRGAREEDSSAQERRLPRELRTEVDSSAQERTIDMRDKTGATALMLAAERGDLRGVQALVDQGAAIDLQDGEGSTALLLAANNRKDDVVEFLVNHNASVLLGNKLGFTPLMEAAWSYSLAVAQLLVARGAIINRGDEDWRTALQIATTKGRLQVVEYLVSAGARVNSADDKGMTPLMVAAESGFLQIAKYLVDSRANVNKGDWKGRTALRKAAENGHEQIARYLTETCSADVDAADNDGLTALIEASSHGHVGIVRTLLDHGADVNANSTKGSTSLILAASSGHLEVVKLLVDRGANVNATMSNRMTAMAYAAKNGHSDTERFLNRRVGRSQVDNQTGCDSDVIGGSWTIPAFELELIQTAEGDDSMEGDYRAKWLDADVAVKLFVPAACNTTFADQVELWRRLRHPNILKLYGASDGDHQLFVYEFASHGTVIEHLASSSQEQRTPWKFLYEAALGLECLHQREIVHGNLRGSNIVIGSDRLAKLANFSLSGSSKPREEPATRRFQSSWLWKAPEKRTNNTTKASDIYAFGLCIAEVRTGREPWAGRGLADIEWAKGNWRPETEHYKRGGPDGVPDDTLALVRRMCCHDPARRPSIAFVVVQLEQLALKEQASKPHLRPRGGICVHNVADIAELQTNIAELMQASDNAAHQHVFGELEAIVERLQSSHPDGLLNRLYSVLVAFRAIITSTSEQTRIMRLSSTRASSDTIQVIHRRIRTLWSMLGESPTAIEVREQRLGDHIASQTSIFVSEVANSLLIVPQRSSPEEQAAILTLLKAEIDTRSSNYTSDQLGVLRHVRDEIIRRLGRNGGDALVPTPEWFIPWCELQINTWDQLGKGGFGRVCRAKWLDADVVVKLLSPSVSAASSPVQPSYLSDSSAASAATVNASDPDRRAEMQRMFQHEVAIWFSLSHPHIVRLFGACHIGDPFFVCELASHGTLVEYLRSNPDALWLKLYEAALGVQLLHERGVVHGDLKGNNIVVGSDEKAKVTDFGLSSLVDSAATTTITAAWHWVAPELLDGTAPKPTRRSDVYALGMCFVEAMRVVEAVEMSWDEHQCPPHPWGGLDNVVVKVRVCRGELPLRPTVCSDEQWKLVERMCRRDPSERIEMPAVVEALSGILEAIQPTEPRVAELSGLSGPPPTADEAISAIRLQTVRIKSQGDDRGRNVVAHTFELLCDRLELVALHVEPQTEFAGAEALRLLLCETHEAAATAAEWRETLAGFTEASLRGFALHRRLDKLIAVHFQPAERVDMAVAHEWKAQCCSSIEASNPSEH